MRTNIARTGAAAALVGCAGHEPANPCSSATSEQFATLEATTTELVGCGSVTLGGFEVLGEGTLELSMFTDSHQLLPKITSSQDGARFAGLRARGEVTLEGTAQARTWRLPYAGGGDAGPAAVGTVSLGEDGWPVAGEDDGTPPVAGTSFWAGALSRDDGGAALVGALSATSTRITVAFDGDGTAWFAWGGRGESIALDDGEALYLDPLFLWIGPDASAGFAAWAEAVGASTALLAPTLPAAAGRSVAAADEAAASTALGGLPAGAWGRLAGGWASADDPFAAGPGFPEGLAPLGAAEAPLAVVVDPLVGGVAAHPDWALGADPAVIDVSRDDVLDWLAEGFVDVGAAGVEAVELSHASAAATEAGGDVSGIQVYRAALVRIRAALPPGAQLWVTDAPLLPSVGLVDGFGVGPTARDRAALAFAAGRWWWPSPEPATGPDALSDALAAGGSVFVGEGEVEPRLPELVGRRVGVLWDGDEPRTVGSDAWSVLLAPSDRPARTWGPGGEELWTGLGAPPGPRVLEPGARETWLRE